MLSDENKPNGRMNWGATAASLFAERYLDRESETAVSIKVGNSPDYGFTRFLSLCFNPACKVKFHASVCSEYPYETSFICSQRYNSNPYGYLMVRLKKPLEPSYTFTYRLRQARTCKITFLDNVEDTNLNFKAEYNVDWGNTTSPATET